MSAKRSTAARWCWGLASAFSVACTMGLNAQAAKPQKGDDPPTTKKAAAKKGSNEAREAREILKDLQELAASVQSQTDSPVKDKGLADAELLKRFARPERTVTKVTLDAAGVDAMIEKILAATKIVPAKLSGDEEFVRRICLDVIGKLPTPEQVHSFVTSKNKHKRAELIETLLASPDFAKNWARYWRDVVQFHSTNPQGRLINYADLESWFADQLAKNRPWDEIATDMIMAKGASDENGASVFYTAHAAQQQVPPVEIAGEVSRIFLGVQIQCAQCHDHPNDPWKREQFHQFAAFFAGLQARPRRQTQPPTVEIMVRAGTPRYTMPDKADAQKSIPVEPKFFLANDKTPPITPGLSTEQRRRLAASFVTGQDNPWFAKAFVNRVWYVLMGEGFYNPVDDLGPTRTPADAEVLDTIATQWQHGGYDIRWLFRTVLNTKAYQREFRSVNTPSGKTPFASNCPSRLRSDQILDALTQALGMTFDGPRPNRPGDAQGKAAAGQTPQIAAMIRARGGPRFLLNVLFGVDPSTPNDDVLGTIPQALFMMNSPQINRAIQGNASILTEIMATSPNERVALEKLYLRVLARSPNSDEVKTCGRYIAAVGNRKEAFEDILWSLINSTEFISRR